MIALVALLVSRISPSGIGTNARGDVHDVGVFGTSSMMSFLGRHLILDLLVSKSTRELTYLVGFRFNFFANV